MFPRKSSLSPPTEFRGCSFMDQRALIKLTVRGKLGSVFHPLPCSMIEAQRWADIAAEFSVMLVLTVRMVVGE